MCHTAVQKMPDTSATEYYPGSLAFNAPQYNAWYTALYWHYTVGKFAAIAVLNSVLVLLENTLGANLVEKR